MAITGRSFPSHSVISRNRAAVITGASRGIAATSVITRTPRRFVSHSVFGHNPQAQVLYPTWQNLHVVNASNRRDRPKTRVVVLRTGPAAVIVPFTRVNTVHVISLASDRTSRVPTRVTFIRNMQAGSITPPSSDIALQFIYWP